MSPPSAISVSIPKPKPKGKGKGKGIVSASAPTWTRSKDVVFLTVPPPDDVRRELATFEADLNFRPLNFPSDDDDELRAFRVQKYWRDFEAEAERRERAYEHLKELEKGAEEKIKGKKKQAAVASDLEDEDEWEPCHRCARLGKRDQCRPGKGKVCQPCATAKLKCEKSGRTTSGSESGLKGDLLTLKMTLDQQTTAIQYLTAVLSFYHYRRAKVAAINNHLKLLKMENKTAPESLQQAIEKELSILQDFHQRVVSTTGVLELSEGKRSREGSIDEEENGNRVRKRARVEETAGSNCQKRENFNIDEENDINI